jgi:hypothetical protein
MGCSAGIRRAGFHPYELVGRLAVGAGVYCGIVFGVKLGMPNIWWYGKGNPRRDSVSDANQRPATRQFRRRATPPSSLEDDPERCLGDVRDLVTRVRMGTAAGTTRGSTPSDACVSLRAGVDDRGG